jgi:hypothetical protein
MAELSALILRDSNWLLFSMLFALGVTLPGLLRPTLGAASGAGVFRFLNLFYGVLIGTMAFGHLLAVSIKLANGTLRASVPFLYTIGLVLLIPAWWLALNITRYLKEAARYRRTIIGLNAALGIALLGIGLANVPLAIPAALNIGYQIHERRAVGRGLVTFTVVLYSALFVGAVVFFASGKSFEEFSNMR